MNLLRDICGTFCDGLAMREVPMGFAIRTPFKSGDGDAVALYLRRDAEVPGRFRLEDDGGTVSALQEEGFSLENEPRLTEFQGLLTEHGCLFDEDEYIIHTDYMDEARLPAYFLKFMSLMLRVSDLRMLSRERVRDSFKADLQAFVEEAFEGEASVERDAAPSPELSDYVADVLVTGPAARLAIFAGTTEVKALEALVLWQELARQGLSGIIPVVILESAKPQHIKGRTMSRIINSDVALASMDGSKWDVTQKLRQQAGIHPVH